MPHTSVCPGISDERAHYRSTYLVLLLLPLSHFLILVPGKGIFTLPESTFPINRIEDEINQELDSIRGVVKAFLNNPEPTTWISPDSIKITQSNRKFIGDLQIPSYRDGAPSLLFHNLDECDDEEIEMIFGSDGRQYVIINCALNTSHSTHSSTLICNTSGSGKTRRMLEGLTKYWGFYFVATPGSNGVGVRDLRGALDDVAQYPEWAPDLKPFKSEERAAQHKINCCIASLHLRRVVAARIVIFELFLQLAMEVDGTLQEKHKRTWLLLQLSDDFDPSRRLASFRSDHDVSYPRLKSSS